jgi:hypothetical protein
MAKRPCSGRQRICCGEYLDTGAGGRARRFGINPQCVRSLFTLLAAGLRLSRKRGAVQGGASCNRAYKSVLGTERMPGRAALTDGVYQSPLAWTLHGSELSHLQPESLARTLSCRTSYALVAHKLPRLLSSPMERAEIDYPTRLTRTLTIANTTRIVIRRGAKNSFIESPMHFRAKNEPRCLSHRLRCSLRSASSIDDVTGAPSNEEVFQCCLRCRLSFMMRVLRLPLRRG